MTAVALPPLPETRPGIPWRIEWQLVNKGNPDAIAIYERHYSCRQYRDGRIRKQFAPPGETMVLLGREKDCLFGWVKNKVERYDHQVGVNCFVFRNESPLQSSDLIRQAVCLALARWPGERLFTYVDAGKIASSNPGYCFLKAGWRRTGRSKSGLVLLEYP